MPEELVEAPRAGVELQQRVRAAYDRIASDYDRAIGGELPGKPVDRALLSALVELCGPGPLADVGCGPGHVTRHIGELHPRVVGVDLSPQMVGIAAARDHAHPYAVGSMLDLPVAKAAWSGAAVMYSIIHFTVPERRRAFCELARAVRPAGWILVAFHVDSPQFEAGDVNHLTEWFGHPVDLEGYFLDPDAVTRDVEDAGFAVMSTTVRRPWPDVEHPSRRCYLLAQREGRTSEG
jgi:SAM-dependent methyltransferase